MCRQALCRHQYVVEILLPSMQERQAVVQVRTIIHGTMDRMAHQQHIRHRH